MAINWFGSNKSFERKGDMAAKALSRDGDSALGRAVEPSAIEDDRTGMDVETFRRAMVDNLYYIQGKNQAFATAHDLYMALAYSVRDRMINRWIQTVDGYLEGAPKMAFYLSAEFLMGRQLGNNLVSLGLWQTAEKALEGSGCTLADLIEQEAEPGLGNGGLGRLAACFMDSLAALEYPALGYGIRYEYGIFEQAIRNGWQVECPDRWLRLGNPWELRRPERLVEVKFGGRCETWEEAGRVRTNWVPERTVHGMAYDTLVPGCGVNTVNTLRLWGAVASQDFDFQVFNAGDYARAVEAKVHSETISKVLYPNDNTPQGRELRLKQQYFFTACALQDILRFFLLKRRDLRELSKFAAVQLNDTHPAVAVAELMRLLLDEHGLNWEAAWEATNGTLGYTNHTLLAEALERWPLDLFGRLLPRHLEIIFEINRRFLDELQVRFPGDGPRMSRMSLIEEGDQKQVRMANLAVVGSHAVNGVAALHSRLLRESVLKDFYDLWPERFSNKTNGITPRRWLRLANPRLAELISAKVGDGWVRNLAALKRLEAYVEDAGFAEAWAAVKLQNKKDLARIIKDRLAIDVDPASLFDVQVKRIHEYKRQLLCILYAMTAYNRLLADPSRKTTPRTVILAGKAAPGYHLAKLIIKLANNAARLINGDPRVQGRLRLVFLPNFCVSLGERVYPAADLSEQISTAGKEASGTGNMKFTLNGALTIGTFDGANIEIREAVGADNFFLFGKRVEELEQLGAAGYVPMEYYQNDGELRAVIDQIAGNFYSPDEPGIFDALVDSLLGRDPYFVCADFRAYLEAQALVEKVFADPREWTRRSILNTARAGDFSSDRTISQYAEEIWGLKPFPIKVKPYRQSEAGAIRKPAGPHASVYSIKD